MTAVLDDLRDGIAIDLHNILCDGRHDDTDEPCWTAWRQEADLLMIRVEMALAVAWEDGARGGSCGLLTKAQRARRNPYTRTTASGVNAGQESSPGGADEAPDKAKGSALTEPCSAGDDGMGVWTSPRPHCPCFLHYSPPRKWWRLACACECDHEWGAA